MFHMFFSSLTRSEYLYLFFFSWMRSVHSAKFIRWKVGITAKPNILSWIWWYVYILISKRIVCVAFAKMDSGLCIYHLEVWSKVNPFQNFQWINSFIQICHVMYSFSGCLLHSFCDLSFLPFLGINYTGYSVAYYYYYYYSEFFASALADHIYQPLRSGRIWHKVNF